MQQQDNDPNQQTVRQAALEWLTFSTRAVFCLFNSEYLIFTVSPKCAQIDFKNHHLCLNVFNAKHVTPGRSKASSASTFNKSMKSSVLLQRAELWTFLFFQQIPKPQNWCVLIGRCWPGPFVSALCLLEPPFLFSPSNACAASPLESASPGSYCVLSSLTSS